MYMLREGKGNRAWTRALPLSLALSLPRLTQSAVFSCICREIKKKKKQQLTS